MKAQINKADVEFGLSDEEFWADPWRNRKAIQGPLMQSKRDGLLLGAPGVVPLNQRNTFPVALIRVCKLSTVNKVPSGATLIITAMNLNTGELRAGLALPGGSAPPTAKPAKAAGTGRDSFSGNDSAMVSEGYTLDLASRLRLPVTRGEYILTAILMDQVSNRCRMKLLESAVYEDPAVDEFLREYRASRMPPLKISPEPAEPLPSYRRRDDSPAIPAESGIALSLTRVNIFAPNTRCILSASYRLPVQPQHVVKSATGGNGQPVPSQEKAIVPVSLLLTGSVNTEPKILSLAVPSYEPLESARGEVVATGYFSLDLCRMTSLLVTPQTYFLYVFSGDVMTAPAATAFVRLPEQDPDPVQSW